MSIRELKHSDYIVYVDESGDHSLGSINPSYPVFVLSLCVFQKEYYSRVATPALRMLKFATFGHDMVVLHEYDIRKKIGVFNKLSKEPREIFLNELSTLIDQMEFIVIPIVIDKTAIKELGADLVVHIYHLAMKLGLEKLYQFLQANGQQINRTHVVFEARGVKEDSELRSEFLTICSGNNSLQQKLPFEIVIADKKSNSEGLQFSDMAARPIGLSVLRPNQPNRAFTILERKLYQRSDDYVFPIKAKDPKVALEALAPVR